MGELVRLDITNQVATITLDSQHNRNALSAQLVNELTECVSSATAPGVRAVVLRHEGPAFCSGGDLKERGTGDIPDSRPLINAMIGLMDCEMPTIAVVNGAVRAGGVGLMAACDLVVVARQVTFALTEIRIGVAPAIISVPIMRRVAPARLAGPYLTGEAFTAEQALSMGLVTHVSDDVEETVAALCAGITAGAPRAVAQAKRLLREVPDMDRQSAFNAMQSLSESMFRGPDAQEGMLAFREKRSPNWPT
ncbi:MAG TPA: enoyl-CoA hydratase-related protein [Ilumatobacter sp.]|nr:enoyl-CoA hydratase-related protein [Ilumatobacter sp.]